VDTYRTLAQVVQEGNFGRLLESVDGHDFSNPSGGVKRSHAFCRSGIARMKNRIRLQTVPSGRLPFHNQHLVGCDRSLVARAI
jgi:hypothetical protein